MPNQKNTETVQTLKEKISKAKSIIFADFKGLNANSTNELRQQMKDQNAEVAVAKNTLLKIALKEEKTQKTLVEALDEHLKGNTAAIFSYNDAVAPLKPLVEFAKKFELPKIKAAIIEGIFADAAQVETISKLPSKEQLIAQVVGTMKSPLSGLVNVLGGSKRKFVYAIKAIADAKA